MLSKAAFCYSHIFYCIAYGSVLALPVPSDNISIDTYFQVKEDKGQILLMTKIVLASYRLLLLVFFYHQAYVIVYTYQYTCPQKTAAGTVNVLFSES